MVTTSSSLSLTLTLSVCAMRLENSWFMALVTLRRTQIDSVYSWGMCILYDGIDFSHALAVVMVWELKRELGFFFFFLIICNALLDKNGTPLPVLLIQTNEQEEKNSATAMVLSSWVRMHQGKGWLGALIASKQTFENNTAPILHFSPKQSCSFSLEGGLSP